MWLQLKNQGTGFCIHSTNVLGKPTVYQGLCTVVGREGLGHRPYPLESSVLIETAHLSW